MATLLLRPITRQLARPLQIGQFESGRPLVITIHPGDTIEFREHGRRTTYEVSLHDCAKLAMIKTLMDNYQQDLQMYNQKKKAGYKRIKKPRKPSLYAFNEILRRCVL